jgi:hypothetical protein
MRGGLVVGPGDVAIPAVDTTGWERPGPEPGKHENAGYRDDNLKHGVTSDAIRASVNPTLF